MNYTVLHWQTSCMVAIAGKLIMVMWPNHWGATGWCKTLPTDTWLHQFESQGKDFPVKGYGNSSYRQTTQMDPHASAIDEHYAERRRFGLSARYQIWIKTIHWCWYYLIHKIRSGGLTNTTDCEWYILNDKGRNVHGLKPWWRNISNCVWGDLACTNKRRLRTGRFSYCRHSEL
jgi:hypothetical protein